VVVTVSRGGDGSAAREGDDGWFGDRLARAQRGEPAAFDDLVRWLERPLLGFLVARGADDPDGAANEVLVRVFRRIGGFTGGRVQFRAWVFRIARNALIDEHRRRSSRPTAVPTPPEDLPDVVTDDDRDERLGERARVESMLACLTGEQREVLLLRVVAGLSVDETAQAVDRRPGAVRALQHRALARLRASLAGSP
jgi:RNA polymerase sigma factor (sigma-70 family)